MVTGPREGSVLTTPPTCYRSAKSPVENVAAEEILEEVSWYHWTKSVLITDNVNVL